MVLAGSVLLLPIKKHRVSIFHDMPLTDITLSDALIKF